MLPGKHRFPSRGPAARRPSSKAQVGAMLNGPAMGPNIGALELEGPVPQDIVGSVVRELRTSMLDIPTAIRLGYRGLETYFGTVTAPPQTFTAPSEVNRPDSIRAGVAQSGNANQSLNNTASSGLSSPRLARTLPRRPR